MFYRTLNERFRELMRTHAISDDELRQAADEMKAKQKKSFIIYVVTVAIFSILMIGAGIIQPMIKPIQNIWFGIFLSIAVAIIAGYFLPIGILRIQFNRELKKDYPHLYDELKL